MQKYEENGQAVKPIIWNSPAQKTMGGFTIGFRGSPSKTNSLVNSPSTPIGAKVLMIKPH